MASVDSLTVIERLAVQSPEEKAIRNRLITEGVSIREATRRAAQATGRIPAAHVAETRPAPSAPRTSEAALRKAVRRAVHEALTASQAPTIPAAAVQPARQPAAPKVADRPLHELSADEFSRLSVAGHLGAACESPFWRGARESAPAAPVAETADAPVLELHKLSNDQLLEVASEHFSAQAAARGFGSPLWAG